MVRVAAFTDLSEPCRRYSAQCAPTSCPSPREPCAGPGAVRVRCGGRGGQSRHCVTRAGGRARAAPHTARGSLHGGGGGTRPVCGHRRHAHTRHGPPPLARARPERRSARRLALAAVGRPPPPSDRAPARRRHGRGIDRLLPQRHGRHRRRRADDAGRCHYRQIPAGGETRATAPSQTGSQTAGPAASQTGRQTAGPAANGQHHMAPNWQHLTTGI